MIKISFIITLYTMLLVLRSYSNNQIVVNIFNSMIDIFNWIIILLGFKCLVCCH